MLEQKIRYRFKNRDLLKEALTHSSYGYEKNCPFNERLEFLGDSILGYVVSRELFLMFPDQPEGVLSKMKSVLVSAQALTGKARDLSLGDSMRLGKGETRTGGKKKSSILADAMEALIGAVSLDGGMTAAEQLILHLYKDDFDGTPLDIKDAFDFKTLLQEKLQERALGLPDYVVEREEGPAHKRRFVIRADVGEYRGPSARGSSKKIAQQECAKKFLDDTHFWEELASET